MDNFSKATDLATESVNSQGAAMQKYSVYEDSAAAALERIKNLWQTIVDNIDLEKIYMWLLKIAETLMTIVGAMTETGLGKGTLVVAGLSAALAVFVSKAIAAQKATEGFVAATGAMGKLGQLFTFGFGASPVAAIALIAAGVVGLVAVLDKLIVTDKELKNQLTGTVNEIKNIEDQINSINSELGTTNDRMSELLGKGPLTFVEQTELEKLQQTSVELQRQLDIQEAIKRMKEESAARDAEELYRRSTYNVVTYGGDPSNPNAGVYESVSLDKAIIAKTKLLEKLKDQMDAVDVSTQLGMRDYDRLEDDYKKANESLQELIETATSIKDAPISDGIKIALNDALDYFSAFGKTAAERFSDVFDRADFSVVKKKLLDIANAQEITSETFKNSGEYASFIRVLGNLGISADDAAKYINELAKAENSATNPVFATAQKSYADILSEVAEKAELAAKAQYEYDTTGALSYETVLSLTKVFGDFTDQLELTADGYKFTTGSVKELMNAQIDSANVAYKTAGQSALAVAEANGIQVDSYDEAIEAIRKLILAKKDLLRASLVEAKITGDRSYIAGISESIAELSAIVSTYTSAKSNYEKYKKAAEQIMSTTYSGLKEKDAAKEQEKDQETAYERFVRLTEHKIFLSEQLSNAYVDNAEKYKEYTDEIKKQDALYAELQKATHAEAERLRADGIEKNEKEIDELSEAWWTYENKRREMAKQTAEIQKNLSDTLKEEMIEAINELMDAREKEYEKLDEYYEHQITRLDSIISLTEKYNDMTNTVSSEIRKINSDLEISKASFKYLDENLRKTLFNEADYNVLSTKLNQIANDSSRIYKDYMYEIQNLSEDNMYRIEEITNEFQRQYELKKMEYDVAKNELALVKAQTELQNVMANRNVRMFTGGEWIWTADYAKVQEAMTGVAEAEADVEQSKIEMEQKKIIQNYEGLQDIYSLQKDAAEKEFESMKAMWESIQKGMKEPTRNINTILSDIANNGMPELKNIIASLSGSLSSLIGSVGGDFGHSMTGTSSGGSSIGYDKYLQNKVDWANAQKRGDTATMNKLNQENQAYRDKWGISSDEVTSGDAASILAKKGLYKTSSGSASTLTSTSANRSVAPSSSNTTDSHNIYLGENFASKISSFDFNTITSTLRRYVPITT